MARRSRSAKLETRTARLKLPVRKKPHAFTVISPGIAVGYRRCQGAGRWILRRADGSGSAWTKVIALADDFEDADGEHVLTFWQAQDRARKVGRGTVEAGRPITLGEALDAYATNLGARGGLAGNVSRVRHHLPPALLSKPVALLTSRELERWRDSLTAKLKPATVNRTTRILKAACNLAHGHDEQRITNVNAWKLGLKSLPDAHRPRNVILTDRQTLALITAARAIDPAFGLLTEVAAVTGARPCQLMKLETADLRSNGEGPRLMMPSSRKGHAGKVIVRRPMPISEDLATRLRAAAGDRAATAPLLTRDGNRPWSATSADHRRPFAQAVVRAGLDPSVTIYALRHTSIVRQILAGTPLRVIAVAHDTSTKQIEITYSDRIADHADLVLRRGQLDTASVPQGDNVIAFKG
jgi:hypothetical protein